MSIQEQTQAAHQEWAGLFKRGPSALRWDTLPPQVGDAMVDNPWLLPGEFVVGTDGKLALTYHYNYCENYPDPQVLVAAIKMSGGAT